jgi:hypothetical protein
MSPRTAEHMTWHQSHTTIDPRDTFHVWFQYPFPYSTFF